MVRHSISDSLTIRSRHLKSSELQPSQKQQKPSSQQNSAIGNTAANTSQRRPSGQSQASRSSKSYQSLKVPTEYLSTKTKLDIKSLQQFSSKDGQVKSNPSLSDSLQVQTMHLTTRDSLNNTRTSSLISLMPNRSPRNSITSLTCSRSPSTLSMITTRSGCSSPMTPVN